MNRFRCDLDGMWVDDDGPWVLHTELELQLSKLPAQLRQEREAKEQLQKILGDAREATCIVRMDKYAHLDTVAAVQSLYGLWQEYVHHHPQVIHLQRIIGLVGFALHGLGFTGKAEQLPEQVAQLTSERNANMATAKAWADAYRLANEQVAQLQTTISQLRNSRTCKCSNPACDCQWRHTCDCEKPAANSTLKPEEEAKP